MQVDGRRPLYDALGLVEDALNGGFRLGAPAPEFSEQREEPPATGRPQPTAEAPVAPRRPARDDSLQAIAQDASRCMACRLAASRGKAVAGQGVAAPTVLVVGEGPGAEEDAQGLPFVGPAGQLLDKMLAAIQLSRQTNCYVANVVKCRPPSNRDPAPDEQAACLPFLERQFDVLKPRAVLAVGRVSAQALLGVKDGIGKLRGKAYDYRGVPLVATYHPSALLRDESLKRPAWEDLKLLKSLLGE